MDWVVDMLAQHPHLVGFVIIGPYLVIGAVGLVCLLLISCFGGRKL